MDVLVHNGYWEIMQWRLTSRPNWQDSYCCFSYGITLGLAGTSY